MLGDGVDVGTFNTHDGSDFIKSSGDDGGNLEVSTLYDAVGTMASSTLELVQSESSLGNLGSTTDMGVDPNGGLPKTGRG